MDRGRQPMDEGLLAEDLLSISRGGFRGRRAHRLVYFIESQVAFHKEQLGWACRVLLGKARAEWGSRDVLSGFELRGQNRTPIGVYDLERYAPEWSRLLPNVPRLRANVAQILARKYKLTQLHVPGIRAALGLDQPAVKEAYQQEYGLADDLFGTGLPIAAPIARDSDSRGHDLPAEELLAEDAEWVSVAGGEVVVRAGEPMDYLYVVASGRLRMERSSKHAKDLRGYARGDVLGDVNLLAKASWKTTVRAIRDGELVRISRAAVMKMMNAYPRQGLELTQALVTRSAVGARDQRHSALAIAVLPLDASGGHVKVAHRLADTLASRGPVLRLDARTIDDAVTAGAAEAGPGDDLEGMVASWLSMQETQHRVVLYQADERLTGWTKRCLRQADRVILVASAESDPGIRPIEAQLNERSEVHLVLLHDDTVTMPSGTAAWLAEREVAFHHHVRLSHDTDVARMGRLVTEIAVGAVFGGGGARGFVHPGVLRAFEEQGIVPDIIGGSSMGAVAAGLAALGWPSENIRRLGERLPKSSSLFDYTLPLMSINTGRKVSAFLQSVFGDTMIEDLWTPFFCISTNLSRGGICIHRTGQLWHAVRASVAIPGVFSPVMHQGDVLVDGAVLNNLPVDVMRGLCQGATVIGVQTSIASSGFGSYHFEPDPSGWHILWRRLRPQRAQVGAPSIFSVLLRSFDIKDTRDEHEDSQEVQPDVLIEADTTGLGFLDFPSYAAFADAGYEAARKALANYEWSG